MSNVSNRITSRQKSFVFQTLKDAYFDSKLELNIRPMQLTEVLDRVAEAEIEAEINGRVSQEITSMPDYELAALYEAVLRGYCEVAFSQQSNEFELKPKEVDETSFGVLDYDFGTSLN